MRSSLHERALRLIVQRATRRLDPMQSMVGEISLFSTVKDFHSAGEP
jgi:hypothetical protein